MAEHLSHYRAPRLAALVATLATVICAMVFIGCASLRQLNEDALKLKLIGTQGEQQLVEAKAALAAQEYEKAVELYSHLLDARLIDSHDDILSALEGLCIGLAHGDHPVAAARACATFQRHTNPEHATLLATWPLVAEDCTKTIERSIATYDLDTAENILAATDLIPAAYFPEARISRWQGTIAKVRQVDQTAARERRAQELGTTIQEHTQYTVVTPYDLYQNPFANKGRIIALSPRDMPSMYDGSFVQYVHCDGSVGSVCGLKFDRMLSENQALYDIIVNTVGGFGGSVQSVSQLILLLGEHRPTSPMNMMGPLSYQYLWLVEVLGTTEGRNALGGPVWAPTVKFNGYSE